MKYKRGRVALSPVYFTGNPDFRIQYGFDSNQLHIGHARTLLLGSLICDELGIPFHIRLDGPVNDVTGDRANAVLDAIDLVNTLGIRFDKMYWSPQTIPPRDFFDRELGDRAEAFWWALHSPEVCPDYYRCLMLDDVVHHDPSLIIRGRDFVCPSAYADSPTHAVGTERHIIAENLMFSTAGREKKEINTPLMTMDGFKMSKSQMRIIHWSILRSIPRDAARRFLLATAMNPSDPLSSFGEEFHVARMSSLPYQWSWDVWNTIIRNLEVNDEC